MKHILAAFALCAVLLTAGMTASFADGDNKNMRHTALREFETKDGGKVEYMGHALGLDGWMLIKKDGTRLTAYTTVEGGLVVGQLVDQDGMIETVEQMKALAAKQMGGQQALPGALDLKSSASKAERFYAEVEKNGAWVQAGPDNAPYIYVFMNVSCDHCMEYWKDLEGAVNAGKLQVRLLPWGTAEENRFGGAAMMSSAKPGDAWSAYIKGDKSALSRDKIVDGALAAVAANGDFLKKWNIGANPFTMYRRPEDGKITVIMGRPQNTLLLIADLVRN